ncbi:MAG: hypothetical protein SV377_00470 [Halobacteria archaeon]|nr:hypothetical protein [Halobacteria archaeon]
MAHSFRQQDPDADGFDVDDLPDPCRWTLNRISMHETRPGRVVFTEEDNCDGWIATDLTVEVLE